MRVIKSKLVTGLAVAAVVTAAVVGVGAATNSASALSTCSSMPTVEMVPPFTGQIDSVQVTSNPCGDGVEVGVAYTNSTGTYHAYGNEVSNDGWESRVAFNGKPYTIYYRYFQDGKWVYP